MTEPTQAPPHAEEPNDGRPPPILADPNTDPQLPTVPPPPEYPPGPEDPNA